MRNRTCNARGNARGLEDRKDFGDVLLGDLEDCAGLLVEELRERVAFGELGDNAASAGDRHLRERDRDAAVGAVVVRERLAGRDDLLHGVEEALQERGIRVRMAPAELTVHLRERRRAERGLSVREIDVHEERRLALRIGLEVGREREAHVLDRRERAHDERERGDLLARSAVRIVPHGMHRAAVLADGNRDAELRAELEADFLDGVV